MKDRPEEILEILKDIDKERVVALAKTFNSVAEIGPLWELIEDQKDPYHWRVAWLLTHIADIKPELLIPFQTQMMDILDRPMHNGVHRSVAKILSEQDISEDNEGPLYDKCISMVNNGNVHVAIRVHCMEVAWNIGKKYPDILPELKLIIENHLPGEKPGFKSRGNRILGRINKLI